MIQSHKAEPPVRIDLTTFTPEEAMSAIYIGYFQRAADPDGMVFWVDAYTIGGLSLEEIATDFSTQAEVVAAYDFLSDATASLAEDFLSNVYLNLFNREPDQDGLTFWSGVLLNAATGNSSISIGEVILEIIGGAQDSDAGNDRQTLFNKIEVAVFWTESATLAEVDYENDPAIRESASTTIAKVTDDRQSVIDVTEGLSGFTHTLLSDETALNDPSTRAAEPVTPTDVIAMIGQTSIPTDSDFML